ncbi:small ribosomal subunit Rsm22 family protein [Halalkalicoccus ordinarius]|uniref:small ribosomal subunit Rsm22 family protein n=1 Tax=Halalkalicoccus ordinarius TaxID=3116651 RepID=UPI00300F4F4C
MNESQRRAILDSAKYLRNVRPLDPEELSEYVEGGAHPAVVRQVLREHVVELRLREREDGTFVPAPEEPIAPAFDGVRTVPKEHLDRLEALLVERFGPDWADDETGDDLRAEIRRLKERYYRQHPVEYDYEAALGYALYHLSAYYAATQYLLDELASAGLLSSPLRVLDVGAGVGGPALGLFDYVGSEGALVEYHAVEPSAAADVLETFLEGIDRNVDATIHRTTAEAFEPEGEYDLLVFANVLVELSEPIEVLRRYLSYLAPDGSLIALSPADKNTSTNLRRVERAVVDGRTSNGRDEDGYTAYAPELRLWPGEAPTDRGWSFDRKPDLEVPALQRRLDEGARAAHGDGTANGAQANERDPATGEFVNRDVQYSYSILRRDGRRRAEVEPSPERFAKLADTESHVGDRIDCVTVKLSRSLSEGGNNPLFRVSDGSQSTDHYAVLTRETSLNRTLLDADYGAVLVLEGALALWNADEGAYNLVVDEETVVDRIG